MNSRKFDTPQENDPPASPPRFGDPGDIEMLPRREGFSGAISLPLLPDLIQIYTVSMADGALTIRRGTDRGTIWLEHGEIVHAVCGDITGEEAVYRLLEWNDGHFSLDRDARSEIRTITSSWQNVLMEGCRRLDENAAAIGTSRTDVEFSELSLLVGGYRSVALFDSTGQLLAQRSPSGPDLSMAGAALQDMLSSQRRVMTVLSGTLPLVECFWLLGDQMHLIAPLHDGRLLYLVVDRADVNLPVMRRAVERVWGRSEADAPQFS